MGASERTGERGRERCSRSVKEAGVCISWKEGERGNVLSRVALFMDVRLRVLRLCIKNPRRVERRDESGGSFFV